jgi:DNA repair protein RadC
MEQVSEITVSYRPPKGSKNSPILSTSGDAFQAIYPHFNQATIYLQEQFLVCYLDRGNRIKGVFSGFKGGITGTVADVRIILGIALKSASSGIILAHNHPSGNIKASDTDMRLTSKIKAACEIMDIQLLDHLIVSPNNTYMSFADSGQL